MLRIGNKEKIALVFILILFIVVNYNFLDNELKEFVLNKEENLIEVDRVIDGDTIESNGTSIRLLGVNTPERGDKYYNEAKEFLERKIENETVRIIYGKEKKDRYGRILGYIYKNLENINQEIVRKGYGNYYFPEGKTKRYNNFVKAWKKCVSEGKRLCKKSKHKCSDCIKIKEINHYEQEVIFENRCGFDCNLAGWKIKDEGRKNFVFPEFIAEKDKEFSVKVGKGSDNENELYWEGYEYVWTSSGDTLFLRDRERDLVLWERY